MAGRDEPAVSLYLELLSSVDAFQTRKRGRFKCEVFPPAGSQNGIGNHRADIVLP